LERRVNFLTISRFARQRPAGKFKWLTIERLEIVAEYGSFAGNEVWFDNIRITDQDTATVIETGTLGIEQSSLPLC